MITELVLTFLVGVVVGIFWSMFLRWATGD
jgi:MFS superfamily sulfate permease-like transporter